MLSQLIEWKAPMHRPRIRISAAALFFLFLPAAVGVLAVRASATCERFVKTYVTKPVRNRVSKQTADAWAKWRIGHPDWKPQPALHRPRYVMTRQESVQKVAFACEVDTIPTELSLVFPPEIEVPPPPITLLPPVQSTPPVFPPLTPIPPQLASNIPTPVLPFLPLLPLPVSYASPVPEPASLELAFIGLLVLGLVAKNRFRGTAWLPSSYISSSSFAALPTWSTPNTTTACAAPGSSPQYE
jgi:hypothetical protein